MIEDKATEKFKKRAQKLGLIVNAGVDQSKPKPTTPAEEPTKKSSKK